MNESQKLKNTTIHSLTCIIEFLSTYYTSGIS